MRGSKRCGFDPWVGNTPWRKAWQPTPVFFPGESHGQRNLLGYSPWGFKESDKLSMHTQWTQYKWSNDKSRLQNRCLHVLKILIYMCICIEKLERYGMGCHFLLQCMKVKSESESLSRVRLLATPWTAVHQAPPPMGFSTQVYYSGVSLPSPKQDATGG